MNREEIMKELTTLAAFQSTDAVHVIADYVVTKMKEAATNEACFKRETSVTSS